MKYEYIAILGNDGWYEFKAEGPLQAEQELNKRFTDVGWRLYDIDPVTGQVAQSAIAFSGTKLVPLAFDALLEREHSRDNSRLPV